MRDVDVEFLSPRSDVVTEEEIAQGHEFALHLLSVGLDAYVINADPTRPRFKNLFNPDHKWLVDQPDAVYLTATLSTDYAYIIEGQRTGEVYVSYSVYTHSRGGGWAQNVLAETAYPRSSVSGRALKPDAEGHYRIYVSGSEPTSLQPHEQWLRIPAPGEASSGPAEVSIISRHYFEQKVSVQMYSGRGKADVVAEIAVDTSSQAAGDHRRSAYPPIPTDENVAQRIDFLSNFLVDHTIVYAPGGKESKKPEHRIPDWYSVVANRIGKPGLFIGTCDEDDPGTVCGAGAPDVHYAAGPWDLEPQQALVIEGRFPSEEECVFANVLLVNKFLQSLDYQHGRSQHFNRKQIAGLGSDGSYRLILAHKDPGEAFNWLDTEGRTTGIIFYRFFLNTAELTQATTRVVSFDSLAGLES